MSLKIKDIDKGYRHFVEQLQKADGMTVQVGYFERGELAGLESFILREAVLNEFGLSERGIEGNAPLRMMFDRTENQFFVMLGDEAVGKIVKGDKIMNVLRAVGEKAKKDVQKEIERPLDIMKMIFGISDPDGKEGKKLRALMESLEVRVEKR